MGKDSWLGIRSVRLTQISNILKLVEIWKSNNIPGYPIEWLKRSDEQKREGLKSSDKPELLIKGKSKIQSQTFVNDAALLWNRAPKSIKECKTLAAAKKQIKIFINTLPL